MSNVFFVHGPPGTGKTSYLKQQVERASAKYGASNVVACSYTKAAAVELAGRLSLPDGNVGTIHSLCYRALGCPELVVKHLKDWNAEHGQFGFSGLGKDVDDPLADQGERETPGDQLMSRMELLRASKTPREQWPRQVIPFAETWDGWKKANDLMDFTDLLERGLADMNHCPNMPCVLIVDEAQDLSPLQLSLLLKWKDETDATVFASDTAQTIYEFAGADPGPLMDLEESLPPTNRIQLKRSYRLPRAVLDLSERHLNQLTRRPQHEFLPRLDQEGKEIPGIVERNHADFMRPEKLLPLLESSIKSGKSTMLLASCRYMLNPLISWLRREAIPFHNPYRVRDGGWNPLRRGGHKQITTLDRLLSFLAPDRDTWEEKSSQWTWDDVWRWGSMLKAKGLLRRGTKEWLEGFKNNNEECNPGALILQIEESAWKDFEKVAFFSGEQVREAITWLLEHVLPYSRKKLEFPAGLAYKHGGKKLLEKPLCITGTMHCSPPDEPILTVNRGYVPIGSLLEDFDRLVGYMHTCNRIVKGNDSRGNGYRFRVEKTDYSGIMLSITTAQSKTRVTPNHRMRVRFAPSAQGKFIVYLMRRGMWWRIGVTRAPQTKTNTSVGGNTRLSREKGDGCWVLRLCDTRKEALMEEEKLRAFYGIPGLIFEATPSTKQRTFTSEELHSIHEHSSVYVDSRAKRLADDFGIDTSCPIWKSDGLVRAGYSFETFAANLLPGLMEVPVYFKGKRSPTWLVFGLEKTMYNGPVYSLDVPPHEHYISGGTIVHNSVKGGQADNVVIFPDLSQAGAESWWGDARSRDSVVRLFYVAMTRARESLVVCQPATRWSVPLSV